MNQDEKNKLILSVYDKIEKLYRKSRKSSLQLWDDEDFTILESINQELKPLAQKVARGEC